VLVNQRVDSAASEVLRGLNPFTVSKSQHICHRHLTRPFPDGKSESQAVSIDPSYTAALPLTAPRTRL